MTPAKKLKIENINLRINLNKKNYRNKARFNYKNKSLGPSE